MKKLLAIVFLSFMWCETSNAENKQVCDWIVNEVYADLLKEESNDHLFVVVGKDGRCEYGRGKDKYKGLSECEKHKKINLIDGICRLFAIGEKKVTSELVKKEIPIGRVIWKEKFEDNINECKLLERDPAKIYYRNLNWKEEEKNTKRKRYVYKDQRNLTFRDIKDPSALKEIRFIKLTSGKKIKGIKGLPRIRNTNKMKYQEIEYHAYIYHVTYAKCDFVIEFRVHDKFKRKKADELVKKYAYMLGQIPFFLRHGYEITRFMTEHFRTHRVTILPAARSSFASFEVIEGRKRTVENMFGDMGYTLTLHPKADSKIFYTLLHEAAHAGFERHLLNSRKWFNAVKADNNYITKYARTNPSEDVAETVAYWIAIRCYKDEGKDKRIFKNIPNRIKVLDELNLNTYPLVCK